MLQIYPTEGPVLVSHDARLPRHRTVRSGARHRSSSAFPSSFSPFAQSPSPRSIRSGCGSSNSTTRTISSTTRTISDSDSDRDSDDSSTDHSIHQHPDSLDDDQSEASSSNTTTTKNNSNNDDNDNDNDNHVALFLSFSPESFASVTGDRRARGSASRRSPMRRALDRIHRDTGGDCDGDGDGTFGGNFDGDGKNSRNEAPPCRFFRSKKGCRNGSRCRYQH